MKRLVVFLFALVCSINVYANQITSQQAANIARSFLLQRGKSAKITEANILTTKADGNNISYYAFNVGKENGFVIVSGDNRTEQVLGYSDKGSFDENELPDNMRSWLGEYTNEIANLAISKNNASTRSATLHNKIEPLIQTKWNQGAPYNGMAPLYDGKRCLTGCVATAIAQILYYHKFPERVLPAIKGYQSNSSIYCDALESTTFSWDAMKYTYSSNEEDDNVAKLMRYCGQAVKMNYGTGASAAFTYFVPNVLKEIFGYNENLSLEKRYNYTISEWDELIYNELKENDLFIMLDKDL